MRTLIRYEGFEVRIYTFDHSPPHVHVFKAGAVVRIELSSCTVTEIVGDISDRDVSARSGWSPNTRTPFDKHGEGCMRDTEPIAKDRERLGRARARGVRRARDGSALVGARYNARRDTLELTFKGGGAMVIPRTLVPGLDRVTADLETPVVSPAGDALSWPARDLDVYVPGLVTRAFGNHLFAAATGRKGGRRRTKAKTVAAKLNGAKGGRPRKKLSA